jgi:hypothetical protein
MATTSTPPSDPSSTDPSSPESSSPESSNHEPARPGVAFWASAVIGAAIVLFGIRGLLENEPRGAESAIRWFIGGALVVDLLVVPLGAALGWIGRRAVPTWAWPAVRAGLLTSAVLIAFALPLVLDQGGTPDNPTIRPRDYGTGLTVALVATWLAAGAWLGLAARARRQPLRAT